MTFYPKRFCRAGPGGTVNLTEQRLFSAVLSYPATGLSD
jgi:hypothetical protein